MLSILFMRFRRFGLYRIPLKIKLSILFMRFFSIKLRRMDWINTLSILFMRFLSWNNQVIWICTFQFSLWDSILQQLKNYAKENSLSILFMRFKIQLSINAIYPGSFNSLYEIPGFNVYVPAGWYVLSILFMRFLRLC